MLLGLVVRREPTPLIGDLAHDIAEAGIFRTYWAMRSHVSAYARHSSADIGISAPSA
jgi:hypothetical protein